MEVNSNSLNNIGLTEGEARVYLALVKLGPSTSGPITNKSKVSSSKIYNILERLMQKGIVSFIVKEKTRYYQAEDPAKLKDYLSKKEEDFKKQKEEVDKLIPKLQSQLNSSKNKSEVQIYKGFKGVQTITDHIYLKLKKGESWYNIGIPSYQEEKYQDYWHKDHIRRIKAGIKCKLLFNAKTPNEILKNRNSYKDCEARYMPLSVETPSWILVYRDITVIILPGEEPMSIEITNEQIANSFRQYFEAFWALTK